MTNDKRSGMFILVTTFIGAGLGWITGFLLGSWIIKISGLFTAIGTTTSFWGFIWFLCMVGVVAAVIDKEESKY